MDDEGVLDPRVAEWLEANPMYATPFEDFSPEMLALARGPVGAPPTRAIARVTDDVVEGVPVRFYQPEDPPDGLVVYLHGGGFCIGSIGLMDVARELAHRAHAAVISVEYRLAPAVALRLRGSVDVPLAGQVLMYPGMDGNSFERPSRTEFEGLILNRQSMEVLGVLHGRSRSRRRARRRATLGAEPG